MFETVTTTAEDSPADRYEAAVNAAISTCDSDMRGALKALLIANEFLEAEVAALRALHRAETRRDRKARAA